MYSKDRIVAFIPARGGSKGIKNKNIYPVCDKPLIAYTIEAAKGSRFVDYVMVSTDSKEIASVARNYGAEIPFMRDERLAADTSKTIDAVLDGIKKLNDLGKRFDVLVLLQPTSPLRTSDDIDDAIELFYTEQRKSLVSLNEVSYNPVLIRSLEGNRVVPLLDRTSTVRRQDFEKFYKVNGAIYINDVKEINESTSFNDNLIGFVMKESHSVDIDTKDDIDTVEKFISGGCREL
ncbi:MAG: acylneuraminate cytidylyltransferase family protein [Butyrivibrio sp.]|nr:acylneuraminate cytidylyltransferase family protein [Butyrivibrio sp.]